MRDMMLKGNSRTGNLLFLLSSVFVLLVPDIIFSFYESKSVLSFFVIVLSKSAFLLFMALVGVKLFRSYFITYLLLGLVYIISSTVEIVVVLILHDYVTFDNLKAVYFTNSREVSEFFDKAKWYFMISLLVLVIYIYNLVKMRSVVYEKRNNLLIYAAIALIISVSLSLFRFSKSKDKYKIHNKTSFIVRKYYIKEPPFNFYWRLHELHSEYKRTAYLFKKYKKQRSEFVFGVKNDIDASQRPETVVLIIGEKNRYSNWSINGYERKTSPNLEKTKNLISFSKYYSNANCTANSVPLIITQATPNNPERIYTQKTITSLFKESGYKTTWISSISVFEYINNENELDEVIKLYKEKDNNSDLDILPAFNSLLKKEAGTKKFIVINMLGGHHKKLPDGFNKFEPNSKLKDYTLRYENRQVFINDYDNMIMLEDYVLSKIIEAAKKYDNSSLVLFVPDHGCHLFESKDGNWFGYGSAVPTEAETHIPMFIWLSDKYIKGNEDKYDILLKNKDLLTTNDNVIYSIANLSHINYQLYLPDQSFSDSSYVEPESRFVSVNGKSFEIKNGKIVQ